MVSIVNNIFCTLKYVNRIDFMWRVLYEQMNEWMNERKERKPTKEHKEIFRGDAYI